MYSKMNDNFRDILNCLQNEDNWKEQTRYVQVRSLAEAKRISEALNFFLGGSEITQETKIINTLTGAQTVEFFTVGSKGYYHYIGA